MEKKDPMDQTKEIADLKDKIKAHSQGTTTLNLSFIGIVNGLFESLGQNPATSGELAMKTGMDPEYVERWCDAAYAFGLLDGQDHQFRLSSLGEIMRPSHPQTSMPQVIQSVLGTHMSERIAGLMRTGERPGEVILGERETVLPWFGPMLETTFGPIFEKQIFPAIPFFREIDRNDALAIDLGCGNGWYLRALSKHSPKLSGLGVDGFRENIRQASLRAEEEGFGNRLKFTQGDIFSLKLDRKADMIAMNRALHHVWSDKERLFPMLRSYLAPGGALVLWEPFWPKQREELRSNGKRPLSFQNLGEHAQGNRLLNPEEIAEECQKVGLKTTISLFAEGNESVVVAVNTP